MSQWVGWIELLLETALLAVAFIATYDGARRLALNGLTRPASLMLAAALVLPVYEGGVSLSVPARVRQQVVEQSAMRAPEPPGGWEKMPGTPEQRTTLSLNAATINYMLTGKPGQVVDASGNRVAYVPTVQQIQTREELVRDQKGAEDTGDQFFERGVRLFTTAFVSMLLGLIVGFVQRRRARR
jgi:hypothetical protein